MKAESFPRCLRLRRRREFLRVQAAGRKHHLRHFLALVAAAEKEPATRSGERGVSSRCTRLGVTVTRKIGPAVLRNRIKRLVREAFRRVRPGFGRGLDIVWIAKQSAAKVGYEQVLEEMHAFRQRLDSRREEQPTRRGSWP